MDAIIRMLRPGPIAVRSVRRRTAGTVAGLVALHPDTAWGRVCVTPGADFITRPHSGNDETWLFYPDSTTAPERGLLLEIHFTAPHTTGEDRTGLARSLTRTLQRPFPDGPVFTHELPLRIAGAPANAEYLEWDGVPLEQLRFVRGGRRFTLAGWRSPKPLPAVAEEDLHAVDTALLDVLRDSG